MMWGRKRREIERLTNIVAGLREKRADLAAEIEGGAHAYTVLAREVGELHDRHARVVAALAGQQALAARYRLAWIAAGRGRARLRVLAGRAARAEVAA